MAGSEVRLKPCPFCGEPPKRFDPGPATPFFAIGCGNMDCSAVAYVAIRGKESDAIVDWNRRQKGTPHAGD